MNLQSIVRTYITQIQLHANDELNWFRQQPTLSEAIRFAALATNSKGKRYSHQRRLSRTILEQARGSLRANEKKIEQCKDFDELYTLLENLLVPIKGIGELYVYDTALRIGARLGLLPSKVYLHAGTRVGAQVLGFDGKAKALEVSQLPQELQQLEPHEIEDVLCIFKDWLVKAQTHMVAQEVIKRSWCN
jgi:hypothetical protein